MVNAVPEDKLLAGLVPAEMSASSPPEALKAQAVAARNELLAKIGTRHLTDPYRLCATQHCQVYAGAGREDARATAAVQATRGELLVRDEGGGLVDAVYSASCGGHGENNEHVWGGTPDPSLRGRLDADAALAARLPKFAQISEAELRAWLAIGPSADGPWCARPKEAQVNFRWQKTLDLAAVEARLAVGRLRDLTVVERGVSGRATRLHVKGDGGDKELRGELEIRRALGNLKSAHVRLRPRARQRRPSDIRVGFRRRPWPRRRHVPGRRGRHGRRRSLLRRDPPPVLLGAHLALLRQTVLTMTRRAIWSRA